MLKVQDICLHILSVWKTQWFYEFIWVYYVICYLFGITFHTVLTHRWERYGVLKQARLHFHLCCCSYNMNALKAFVITAVGSICLAVISWSFAETVPLCWLVLLSAPSSVLAYVCIFQFWQLSNSCLDSDTHRQSHGIIITFTGQPSLFKGTDSHSPIEWNRKTHIFILSAIAHDQSSDFL